MLAACTPMAKVCDPEEAEAKAALLAIKLLGHRKNDRIVLELDCANVAAALRAKEVDRSRLWATYEESKTLLKSFKDHRINSIFRESN